MQNLCKIENEEIDLRTNKVNISQIPYSFSERKLNNQENGITNADITRQIS